MGWGVVNIQNHPKSSSKSMLPIPPSPLNPLLSHLGDFHTSTQKRLGLWGFWGFIFHSLGLWDWILNIRDYFQVHWLISGLGQQDQDLELISFLDFSTQEKERHVFISPSCKYSLLIRSVDTNSR